MNGTSPQGGALAADDGVPIAWRANDDHARYEEARIGRVFNHRRPDRYPRAVVEATRESHIVQAVRLAKSLGCRVAVRSGGHSWAVWSVRDDSILVDLGKYHGIELNQDSKIVKASPSTTGSQLNEFLRPRGWFFGGGHCPSVGIGGFLLQGGMGWNCRNWGWACERIAAIDAVTADGELIHCNSEQNQELLWAARGAGPGFPAIVTNFYLEVRPFPPQWFSSSFIYPKSEFETVMNWIIKLTPTADPSTEIVCVGATPPGQLESRIIVHIVTFSETPAAATEALAPFNHSRPPNAVDELIDQPTSYDIECASQAIANPRQHRYCVDNAYISNDADVAGVLKPAFTELPHAKAFALWYAMNPCSRRRLPNMALSMQSDHYFAIYTVWEDAGDDERMMKWTKDIMSGVERRSEGAYLGDADFQTRRTRFWAEKEGRNLMDIRRRWDPEGRICGYLDEGDQSNQNGLANVHEWT